jgi:hypothetical protein
MAGFTLFDFKKNKYIWNQLNIYILNNETKINLFGHILGMDEIRLTKILFHKLKKHRGISRPKTK